MLQHLKKAAALTLLLAFVLGPLPLPPSAAAQEPVSTAGILSSPGLPTKDIGLQLKEAVLDGIATALARQVIDVLKRDIITWIRSGFEGSPAFVTDLGGFLEDVADRTIGNYIEGSGLAFLCSPFKLQVKAQLELAYYDRGGAFEDDIQCTLSGVVENIEDFVGGNFAAGGWDGWFQLTTNPHNNPYGEYLEARAAINARIVSAQGQELDLLGWASGIFSERECIRRRDEGQCIEYGKIITPGIAIRDSLNEAIGSDFDKYLNVDEVTDAIGLAVDQILAATLETVVGQIITGAGGFLGSASASSGGSSSVGSARTNTLNQINSAILAEQQYRSSKEATLLAVTSTENTLKALEQCSGTSPAPLSTQIPTLKISLNAAIASSDAAFIQLNNLGIRARAASDTSSLNQALSDLAALRAQGVVHTAPDQNDIVIQAQMAALQSTANQDLQTCLATP